MATTRLRVCVPNRCLDGVPESSVGAPRISARSGRQMRQASQNMRRVMIVSNRLPVSAERRKGEIAFRRSVGGVATGLASVLGETAGLWVGWPGAALARLGPEERAEVAARMRNEYACEPVFLSDADIRGYYQGFSNRTIWPLFHYFTRFAEFDSSMWSTYLRVNRKFRDVVLSAVRPGDVIWVHDYQLLLLPQMLRDELPDASIGFFLHIPFPAPEVFRVLPWRRELLSGMLGADLIGFHTYDYAVNFTDSVRVLLGHAARAGTIEVEGRTCLAEAFPMGIDFDAFQSAATSQRVRRESARISEHAHGSKLVLSVDRLDYTKGIPERLRAFGAFLERHPEWRGRVSMMVVAVPSRTGVEQYRRLKAEADGLVGSINGKYGDVDWMPIRYIYRSLPIHSLVAAYSAADVALVTPLRDGMNLIAKEYLASRPSETGVLVLSEMAGAARELAEAIIVNPFDLDGMVEALETALTMPKTEQRSRNRPMRERLGRYTVSRWAQDFLDSLCETKLRQLQSAEHWLDAAQRERLVAAYRSTKGRRFVLDYDGTLIGFAARPSLAVPSPDLIDLLRRLAKDERNAVAIVSGRDRDTLGDWFGDLPIDLIAEHGAWIRDRGQAWCMIEALDDEWKSRVRPVLEMFVDRTPGSSLEEKTFSLAWHYRLVGSGLAEARLAELRDTLSALTSSLGLAVMEGNRVTEVKLPAVHKGRAALRYMNDDRYGFVLAAGDDQTDEDLFEAAPPGAWTIRVGGGPTKASFTVNSHRDMLDLLSELAGESDEAS